MAHLFKFAATFASGGISLQLAEAASNITSTSGH
jgi:hypothetical protein